MGAGFIPNGLSMLMPILMVRSWPIRPLRTASLAGRKLAHGRTERCCEPVCKIIRVDSTTLRSAMASAMV